MTKSLFTNSNYNFPNVLRNALDELIIDCHRSSPVAPAPDHFLPFYQGGQQARTIGRCPNRHTVAPALGI